MKILRPPLHENFALPTREDLLKVKTGDNVKLLFDGDPVERMWVKVTSCDDDDVWSGTLDNKPLEESKGKVGDPVSFHPLDVICC